MSHKGNDALIDIAQDELMELLILLDDVSYRLKVVVHITDCGDPIGPSEVRGMIALIDRLDAKREEIVGGWE